MTIEEVEILLREDVRRSIEENLERDPLEVALDKSVAHASLVSSQVKYLAKARTKLPLYYAARCIIPSLSFEQSSGEAAAAQKDYAGRLCVDLTCGLGVDSYYLSKRFERIVAVERDPVLAEIARVNFRLLGAVNIEVVNSSAEEFIAANDGLSVNGCLNADMVYADPDRRSADGRKLVTLADCSPNIAQLMPAIEKIAPVLVVKLSPMFDIHEAVRQFGPNVRVEVVSQGGECKEIVVEKNETIESPLVKSSAIGIGQLEYTYGKTSVPRSDYDGASFPSDFKWLIVPDIALAKAENACRYYTSQGLYIETESSFAFAPTPPESPFGKVYRIETALPYSPKHLKKELKARGITRLNILKRNFPMKSPEIARALSVAEGGDNFAAFTTLFGKRWCVFLSRKTEL